MIRDIFEVSFWLRSDNLKAAPRTKSGPADQKRPRGPKLVGIVAIAVALAMCGEMAHAQANFLPRQDRARHPRRPAG